MTRPPPRAEPADWPPYEPVDLGDGLLLRSATPRDAAALVAFNEMVHGGPADVPDVMAGIWTRDLLRGDHPTARVNDCTVVTDRATGRIVSSCLLISQSWTFDGVAVGVGRPELIGTDLDFRGRGLIGHQLARIHQRSQDRGHLVQALSGIPFYYRRFGYEPALINPAPATITPVPSVQPRSAPRPPFTFRPAAVADAPFIAAMYRRCACRSLIAAERDAEIWRYELADRDPGSDYWHTLTILESAAGPAGLIATLPALSDGALVVSLVEIDESIPWFAAAAPIVRFLAATARDVAARSGEEPAALHFDVVPTHPLLQTWNGSIARTGRPFAWQLRVHDLAALLRRLAPVFERRLAASAFADYAGGLTMTFYDSGLRLGFESGALTRIDPWLPDPVWKTGIALPRRWFLCLLFGSATVDQVLAADPDCRVRDGVDRALLESIFPAKPSVIWPVA